MASTIIKRKKKKITPWPGLSEVSSPTSRLLCGALRFRSLVIFFCSCFGLWGLSLGSRVQGLVLDGLRFRVSRPFSNDASMVLGVNPRMWGVGFTALGFRDLFNEEALKP